MKHMKRIASLLLAMIMVFAMMTTAFAADEESTTPPTPGITINGIGLKTDADGNETTELVATYKIYRMLDLESFNTAEGAYAYKVNSNWTGFFQQASVLALVEIDADGYVTWKGAEDEATKAAFAQSALAYAEANGIPAVKSSADSGTYTLGKAETTGGTIINTLTFGLTEADLGYYLVDSTVGALCGLTTTNPHSYVNAKNGAPTIDKKVQEDSTQQYGPENTADIGQIVNFQSTITVHAGAQKYKLHDTMSKGLTFQPDSVTVTLIKTGTNASSPVDAANFTVYTTESVDGEGNPVITDSCTFEVWFSDNFVDDLATNDKLVVGYSAMLNRHAVIAGDGNDNETWLDYGDGHSTTHSSTTTKTYAFDLVKTDGQYKLIDGAEFRIYDAQEGGNEVGVVPLDKYDDEGNEIGVYDNTYRRARADELADGKTVNIVVKDGIVRLVGFDNGTYYLEEKVAPDGFNKLTARQDFTISDANDDAVINDNTASVGNGVVVVNKSGSMLPETGGIGTTIFYAIGGILVVAAVVLLVTKKRMEAK